MGDFRERLVYVVILFDGFIYYLVYGDVFVVVI